VLTFNSTTILRPRQTRRARFLCLLAAGLVAVATAFQAARIAAIVTLGQTGKPSALETALILDPANPELHHSLGMVQFYSSPALNAANGLWHLRRGTELNPNEALYWLDLGSACEAIHDTACAGRSFDRAIAVDPTTPRLYWAAANYALRAGHAETALILFRRLLDLDSGYAKAVFQVCNQMLDSAQWAQASTLNLNPGLRLALVNYLDDDGQGDLADAVWRQLAVGLRSGDRLSSAPFAFSTAEPYLDHLIASGKQREAMAVWNDLLNLGVITGPRGNNSVNSGRDEASNGDYIFNGGFEQTPLNAGFDWRYSVSPTVFVAFSNAAAHGGLRSARIDFTEDRNEEYEPIYQFVPVKPKQSYLLSAFVRTDGITSETGPCLRVLDPSCPACLGATTEPTIGTTAWHQIRVSFTTGPQTSLVKISVWRPRSRTFPFEITGTFWLDDVSLTTAQPDTAPGALAKSRVRVPALN
jgi:tetratricopeptide (TPR) repeat protein